MANLKYRDITTSPAIPVSTTALGIPLTNLEIDGNFKSLNDDIQTRAPIASPSFTGVATIPAGSATVAGGMKLTSGALKTTPVAGDSGGVEYDGSRVSIIDSTGSRKQVVYSTDTIANATNAINSGITNDTTTATAVYPVFSTGNSGNNPLKVTSTKLSYVPSTGALTSTGGFVGDLTGTSLKANGLTGGLVGSIPTQSSVDTTSLLAGNITTTKQFLSQTGTGTVSAIPVWSVVTKADIGLNLVENTALSNWAGSTAITTLGTISSGTWSATTIGVSYGGTGVTTSTGSGSNVLSNTPTLVSPILGTPTSGNLSNCTFPTLNQNTTGSAATSATATPGTNTTAIATTAFVTAAITAAPSFPTGTRMPFAQAAAPTGWTQDVSDNANDRMLRVVNSTGGGVAGSHSPILNNVVPSHTHGFTTGTVSADHSHGIADPGHSHSYTTTPDVIGFQSGGNNIPSPYGNPATYTTAAAATGIWTYGASANHTHSGGTDNGSSQTNWTPRYINMIICAKN